jgi:hypothetical protein
MHNVRYVSRKAHQRIKYLADFHLTACRPPHQKCLASLLAVALQQSVNYFSGFGLATISLHEHRFGDTSATT